MKKKTGKKTPNAEKSKKGFKLVKHNNLRLLLLLSILFVLSSSFFFQKYKNNQLEDKKFGVVNQKENSFEPQISKAVKIVPIPNSPKAYGFTKRLVLDAVGIEALFPEEIKLSLEFKEFYTAKNIKNDSDGVVARLVNYDGGGRRAWFLKENPWAKSYNFETFKVDGLEGYIAYAVDPKDLPGGFYYFTAVDSVTMLVINGFNYSGAKSVFFGVDLNKFKSFLSTVKFINKKEVDLEEWSLPNYYRWSDKRVTLWQDSAVGLKITGPEWTESRGSSGKRDENGNYVYSDWFRTQSKAVEYFPVFYYKDGITKVQLTGTFSTTLFAILPISFNNKTIEESVRELLIPAGFCASEFKESKEDCIQEDFCYTKEEVLNNLVVKERRLLGTLEAQLRNVNENFSYKNDCRSEDTWVIKGLDGRIVATNISPSSGTFRIEPF